MTCCDFGDAADRQFTAEKVAKELEAYRKGRLGPTTRLLRDGIVELGLSDGSLLDIGGGVGALTFDLLERGMTEAVVADASAAYVAAAREEANRRGRAASAAVVHGDLLQLSAQLPAADLVTLDRVVCCYPAYEPMLEEAARHALRGLAVSYPRDRWFVWTGMWLENARRSRKSGLPHIRSPADADAAGNRECRVRTATSPHNRDVEHRHLRAAKQLNGRVAVRAVTRGSVRFAA